jgi:hypothetical protein
MAEFVDNSLQSFLDHRAELEQADGTGCKLRVDIEMSLSEEGRIVIRDNAAGIHHADYERAFRPAAIPPDNGGLGEFGMGMKSAACWFAEQWLVRTSALGEPVERTVAFDIETIVRDSLEDLHVGTQPVNPSDHYTEIVLSHLYKPPQTRTITKMREHLASIYRMFIRDGLLVLRFDNEVLSYPEPKILQAPYFKEPGAAPAKWSKEIDFDFGRGLRAFGFAALREHGSTSSAGFSLFRRRRLIQGSADEGYRPESIFGKSNSFTFQRLFGELELDGFEVSHTKDGFRWDENEDAFLDLLKEHLDAKGLPLISQAEGYRARPQADDLKRGAEIATQRTAGVIERDVPPILEHQLDQPPESQIPPIDLSPALPTSKRIIDVALEDAYWRIELELSDDPAIGDWLSICDAPSSGPRASNGTPRRLGVRLALAHPFMQRFGGTDATEIEPLLRVAAALALAETTARESGVKQAGTIRRNLNDLLRNALCKP